MTIFPKSDIGKVILIFCTWRVLLFAIAAFAPILIPQFGAKFPYWQERLVTSKVPYFIWSFGNFDGVHYLGIAKDGYSYQFTQAFFPLYPILIKLVSFVTFQNFLVAALLVSNTVFLLALILFFKLISRSHDKKTAFWSIIFLVSFPTAFYFGSVYTEGLFFLTVIGFFYLIEKKRFILASFVAAFASATRLIGIFLAPSLLIKRDPKAIVPLLTGALGLLSYILYLKIKFNNPLYFLNSQEVFGQARSTSQIVLLPQVFWRYFKILTATDGLPFINAFFELSATVFALSLLIFAYKKVKPEWLIFSALAILIPTFTGTLASMPRYIIVAFPLFVLLSTIKSNQSKVMILFLFAILQVSAVILFTRGYWVA